MTMSRAEVITSVQRRRRWSREEKERLVAASLELGAGVSEVARAAGIHVSQLFRWRKELCVRSEASVAPLVPVEIVPSPRPRKAEEPSSTTVRRHASQGIIEIELGGGCCVRVDRDVDAKALQRVLELLRRR
jgi:transposase